MTKPSNMDCRVYVKLHMKMYKSIPFNPHITTAPRRNYFQAKVCASLVLSKLNMARSDVLEKVQEFKPKRQVKLKELQFKSKELEKRKKKKIIRTSKMSRRGKRSRMHRKEKKKELEEKREEEYDVARSNL